jgi:hypothetical protein
MARDRVRAAQELDWKPSLDFHATPLSVGFCQKAV